MDETALPVTEHLVELRSRLLRILLAWFVGAILAWSFAEQIFAILLAPAVAALAPEGTTLQAIAPTEIFFTYLKSALLAGFPSGCSSRRVMRKAITRRTDSQ